MSEFLDVGDQYQSLGFGHLQYQPGYSPVEVRMKFREHTSPMVFQICPYIHDGKELPPAVSVHGELKPTPWFFRVPIVSCGSAEKISFVMFDPVLERQKKYSIRENPYYKLRSRVARAVSSKTHEGWASLLKGNMDVPIPNYKDQYFVQGVVWSDGDVPVFSDKGLPVGLRQEDKVLALIRLSKTAIEPIRAAVMAATEAGVETISLATPQYFGIANREKCKDINEWLDYNKAMKRNQVATTFAQTSVTSMADLAAFNAAAAAVGVNEAGEDEFVGYEAGMAAQSVLYDKGQMKMPLPVIDFSKLGWDNECRRKYVSWEKMFTVMSDQEQAVHIARSLSDYPEVLSYAWGDTDFWTEEVQGIVRKRLAMRVNANRLDDSIPASGAGLTGGLGASAGNAFAAANVVPQSAMNVFANNPHAAAAQPGGLQSAFQQLPQVEHSVVTPASNNPPPTNPPPTNPPAPVEDIMSRILGGGQ